VLMGEGVIFEAKNCMPTKGNDDRSMRNKGS